MAWTTPKTWVASEQVDASEMNTELRDNLNETAPGKASGAGNLIVTDGANSIVERTPNGNTVATAETTTSTSYTDLATNGPARTVVTGTAAFVILTCQIQNNTAGGVSFMGFTVSSATTIAAADSRAFYFESNAAGDRMRASAVVFVSNLTAGSNVFTAAYRVSAGTGTFAVRDISVIPL